jgi:hypothetical protein
MVRRVPWLVGLSILAIAAASVSSGCSDDRERLAEGSGAVAGADSAQSEAGGGGATSDDLGGHGGGGNTITCDCGDERIPRIPLECACDAGLCSTFEEDLVRYQDPGLFGSPYYVLLGTCKDGYRSLSFEEATEQSGRRVFDGEGRMVYDTRVSIGASLPAICGADKPSPSPSVDIGEDPAPECTYCLLAGDDEGAGVPVIGQGGGGGAGAAGEPYYPESRTPRCEPE